MEFTGVVIAGKGEMGVAVVIHGLTSVPKMDIIGHSDTFVRAEVFVGDEKKPRTSVRTIAVAQGKAAGELSKKSGEKYDRGDAMVDDTLHLGELDDVDRRKTRVRFTVRNQETLVAGFIGEATITLDELASRTSHTLLVHLKNGDPTLRWVVPPTPCELHVSVVAESLPSSWPAPAAMLPPYRPLPYVAESLGRLSTSPSATADAPKSYPRHVLMMSRGTRGDVQPFVALARGLASELGWLVTIVTELAWRDFVVGKCADVSAGAVRFLPSGGDTALQTSGYVEQTAMATKTEVMQMIMLAASEANFFASAPVVAHQISRANADQRIDALISGFTMTGVGLMLSERFNVPIINYCLQPTCIPSTDREWQSVTPIETHTMLSFIDKIEEHSFTSHSTLQPLKRLFESNPFSTLSLPKLRAAFGLQSSDTWSAILGQALPVVIPMNPSTFTRPSTWHPKIHTTDFIFLRDKPGERRATLSDEVGLFCARAREQGRKLVVMTFSSMPISRGKMLACAVKMVSQCATPMSLIYVGKRQPDTVPTAVRKQAAALTADGSLLEVDRADFGLLFQQMDAFIVHGGLGTTVEAMRMKKPVAVTGILLFDQRWWGAVVHEKGIGPPPVHIEVFKSTCVSFVNKALDPTSDWARNAAQLDMGAEEEDGVHANVSHFAQLVESGELVPATRAARESLKKLGRSSVEMSLEGPPI